MPSPLLQLRIPQDLADWLEAKYPSRGEVAEYVRQLLTAEQMKEAVAPLVPDENWDAFSVGQLEKAVEARRIPTNAEFDAHKAKPKARRKKVAIVDPATATDSEIEKAKAAGWKIPSRCNRGACTGTIKPSGRCIRCNQEPLKESK